MTRNYWLSISDPAPSMGRTVQPFAGSYAEACVEARRLWRELGRSVFVADNEHAVRWYYRVDCYGVARDVNGEGGVCKVERIVRATRGQVKALISLYRGALKLRGASPMSAALATARLELDLHRVALA
jgi:hypothetical protein